MDLANKIFKNIAKKKVKNNETIVRRILVHFSANNG